jgi:integrase
MLYSNHTLEAEDAYNLPIPSLPKYLIQDELKRFFAAINLPSDLALFGLIYHYRLRVGETLMLTVDDINFRNHRITIRRLKNGLGGEKPLWRHTAKLMRRYLREWWDVGPYLFGVSADHAHGCGRFLALGRMALS